MNPTQIHVFALCGVYTGPQITPRTAIGGCSPTGSWIIIEIWPLIHHSCLRRIHIGPPLREGDQLYQFTILNPDMGKQELPDEETNIPFSGSAKLLDQFLSENSDLLTLLAVFGAFTVYLSTVNVDSEIPFIQETATFTGFSIVFVFCLLIIVKALYTVHGGQEFYYNINNVPLLIFIYLFCILTLVIAAIIVSMEFVGASMIAVLTLLTSFYTLGMIASHASRKQWFERAARLPFLTEMRAYFVLLICLFLLSTKMLNVPNPDTVFQFEIGFNEGYFMFLFTLFWMVWFLVIGIVLSLATVLFSYYEFRDVYGIFRGKSEVTENRTDKH